MSSMVKQDIGHNVGNLVQDIHRYGRSSRIRDTTWARKTGDKEERRRIKNKMGYQIYDSLYWTKPQCARMPVHAHGCRCMRTDANACAWMRIGAWSMRSDVRMNVECLKNIDRPPSLMRIHAAWIYPALMCIHAPWMRMLLDFRHTPNFIPNWPKTVGPLISDLGPYPVFVWPLNPPVTLPCPYPMTECHPSCQQVHHTAFSAFSSSLAHGTLNLAPAMTLHHSPACASPPSPENLNAMRRPSKKGQNECKNYFDSKGELKITDWDDIQQMTARMQPSCQISVTVAIWQVTRPFPLSVFASVANVTHLYMIESCWSSLRVVLAQSVPDSIAFKKSFLKLSSFTELYHIGGVMYLVPHSIHVTSTLVFHSAEHPTKTDLTFRDHPVSITGKWTSTDLGLYDFRNVATAAERSFVFSPRIFATIYVNIGFGHDWEGRAAITDITDMQKLLGGLRRLKNYQTPSPLRPSQSPAALVAARAPAPRTEDPAADSEDSDTECEPEDVEDVPLSTGVTPKMRRDPWFTSSFMFDAFVSLKNNSWE
ncbi:hypothetical protein DFH08DRAFT_817748 [Mycena albidolilacea]|uniref:Uncharacterized protein n=1 Tax=Mycena albidolilacea TaxID=1033008 RepID=A0AAD6ZIE7_9AGAR|nr:hypothetical protein DFH08DRAFT_817748 [Mycena albidolilacea]